MYDCIGQVMVISLGDKEISFRPSQSPEYVGSTLIYLQNTAINYGYANRLRDWLEKSEFAVACPGDDPDQVMDRISFILKLLEEFFK